VVPTEVGGAFGGKSIVYLQPIAAMLSRKAAAGQTRDGSRIGFSRDRTQSRSYIRVKMAADAEDE